ncbi:OmpA family protein [Actinomadura fibrosa]|uniref:OmpA family protein n=1 Tax=Actinomadura fibrosa TaxID=111802 RepID=A0ABW2XFA8_9ACTN|nr:OmpA family protein [Actinomadura fibrosa]
MPGRSPRSPHAAAPHAVPRVVPRAAVVPHVMPRGAVRAVPWPVSVAASAAILLLAAGCADSAKAEKADPPTVTATAPSPSATPSAATLLIKEGYFGAADGLHARVQIAGVQRLAGRSVLRYTVTSLDTAPKTVPFTVRLLDPVGRKLYRQTSQGGQTGEQFQPNAAREMTAEFPEIPTSVTKLTVLTTGTAGEFTGVPVTSDAPSTGAPSPSPSASLGAGSGTTVPGMSPSASVSSSPAPGQPLTVPTSTTSSTTGSSPSPSGSSSPSPGTTASATPSIPQATGSNPADLYEITEGEVEDVTAGNADATISLRTDVLFNGGTATLSSRAKQILDATANKIKSAVDPAKRTLTFTGHTDSGGDDAHNLALSKDRAEAVQKEMKARLGGSYTYSAEGKGESGPVAKEGGSDDAQAKARNRRVEISYKVTQTTSSPGTATPGSSNTATPGTSSTATPGTSSTATPGASGSASPAPSSSGAGGVGAPAAFRPQDGATVTSRSAKFGNDKRRLEVKPFYRDGAYIVAVFDIVNEGPGTTPPTANYAHKDYPGGVFSAFSVSVSGGKDVYRAVRVGTPDDQGAAPYVDPGLATFRTAVNAPSRGFMYLPAPPGNPSSVVFDAGPFGKVNSVPVS